MRDRTQLYARFEIRIKLPKMSKEREIVERDSLGRIIHSQPQPIGDV